MALATIPGYPRIGKRRELKRALEGYWSGKRTAADLEETASSIRRANWDAQTAAGLDLVPVNDFSLYDHVLDTCALVGAIPPRFGWTGDMVDHDLLFVMARGGAGDEPARAMELTKWFDTNYHYLVPEFSPDQTFRLASDKPFAELAEAQSAGIPAKPVLLGPITFLLLGKMTGGDDRASPLSLLDALLPVYAEVIQRLASDGAEWIQIDEPVLVTDLSSDQLAAVARAYTALAEAKGPAKLLLQTAYGHVGEAYPTLAALPVDGIGLDFVRGPQNLDFITQHGFPADKWLVAGVVDGRNVWTNVLAASLDLLGRIQEHVPSERLMISTSSSLQHVPYDVAVRRRSSPGGAPLARLRRAEAGRDRDPHPGGERGGGRRRCRAGHQSRHGRVRREVTATPQPGGAAAPGRIAAGCGSPRAALCRARQATAAAPEPAAVADHDHRLLPTDR